MLAAQLTSVSLEVLTTSVVIMSVTLVCLTSLSHAMLLKIMSLSVIIPTTFWLLSQTGILPMWLSFISLATSQIVASVPTHTTFGHIQSFTLIFFPPFFICFEISVAKLLNFIQNLVI